MKVGDKVLVNIPNRYEREKYYWQPFEILAIRNATVRLRGLCVPSIEITGDNIDALRPYREAE